MEKCAFISDVHINPLFPNRLWRFEAFLNYYRKALFSSLYLLGDIFDLWVGDRHLELSEFQDAIKTISNFCSKGTQVFFIKGNRDYLLDTQFAAATGIKILGVSASIKLGRKQAFLTHGDFLYNKNTRYNLYRKMMENTLVKNAFTSIPPKITRTIASGWKMLLDKNKKAKGPNFNLIEPAKDIFSAGYDVIICGHLHTPRKIQLKIGNKEKEIFILGSWDKGCEYLEYENGNFNLSKFLIYKNENERAK